MQTRKFLLIRQRDSGQTIGLFSFLNKEERNQSSYKILKFFFNKEDGFFKEDDSDAKEDIWINTAQVAADIGISHFYYSDVVKKVTDKRQKAKINSITKSTDITEHDILRSKVSDTKTKYKEMMFNKIYNIIEDKNLESAYSILKYVLTHKREINEFFHIEEVEEGINDSSNADMYVDDEEPQEVFNEQF